MNTQYANKSLTIKHLVASSTCIALFCLVTQTSLGQDDQNKKQETTESADTKIMKALTAKASFDFVDCPLDDALKQIAMDHAIPIHVDIAAIEDSGFDIETPMTGRANGRTLRSALNLLFKAYDFKFVIQHESLVVTSGMSLTKDGKSYAMTKTYDVSAFVDQDVESFIKTIQQVDAESWMEEGGYASLSILKIGNRAILAATHTSEHHYKIQKLLDELNKHIKTE